MFLKKSILTLSLLTLSTIAMADLTTKNYTDEDSSVKVTSGVIKPCSSDAGVYTPKRISASEPGISTSNNTQISILCKTSKNNECTADIYNTSNCGGVKVGHAALDLTSKTVKYVVSDMPSKYVFISENGGTLLTIKYAS